MFESISTWLISEASRQQAVEPLMAELGQRLVAEGFPLWKMHVNILAMHPEVLGRSVRWTRGGVTVDLSPRSITSNPAFVGSPIEAIRGGLPRIRVRLVEGELPYRQLVELRGQGGTDYFLLPITLGGDRRTFISLATDAPSGFTDEQLQGVEALLPALAIRFELESTRFSAETLLQLYLGPNAASRVLAGDFRRGTGQVIHAAVWLCDLRGFTALADRLPVTQVVPVLDAYFEAMAKPVSSEGGEILKFIGDSILAVFPTNGDPASACRRAVASASSSIDAFSATAPAREHGLRVGVAVNLGEVMYGNIGASDRLDFTVIGAAVNESARMESMCKALGTPLILSDAVAKHLDADELVPLGQHLLRGVTSERPLFTLVKFGAG